MSDLSFMDLYNHISIKNSGTKHLKVNQVYWIAWIPIQILLSYVYIINPEWSSLGFSFWFWKGGTKTCSIVLNLGSINFKPLQMELQIVSMCLCAFLRRGYIVFIFFPKNSMIPREVRTTKLDNFRSLYLAPKFFYSTMIQVVLFNNSVMPWLKELYRARGICFVGITLIHFIWG